VLEAVPQDEGRSAAEFLPLVYDELRRLARSRLAKIGPGQTLQATALVHEAWLRVVGDEDPGWQGRAHFFGAAAQAMRNILVEQYRSKSRRKRDAKRIELQEEELEGITRSPTDVLLLDEALNRLEARDRFKARLVMLRFFTGLSMPASAEILGVPLTRVEREWRFTRAWLQREVEGIRLP
jgi:RNA polymerase sigma factor (TIGR02999 family)